MAGVESRARVTFNSPPPKRPFCRRFLAPSPVVRAKLGPDDQQWLAVWVDVHMDAPGDASEASPVRLGWVTGGGGELISTKQRLVHLGEDMRPATVAPHSVAEAACEEGVSLEAVLNDFMRDVLSICMDGGRLLSHDLATHGGVVERALRRCRMTALEHYWRAVQRQGLCLMDDDIGMWLRECCNRQTSQKPSNNKLPMSQMLHALLPEYCAMASRGLTASENAAICVRMIHALHELAVPPCRRPGGRHVFQKVFETGMRDNNEYRETCAQCGYTL